MFPGNPTKQSGLWWPVEHFLHRIIIQSYIFQPDWVNVLVGEHSTNTKNNLCTRWHRDTEMLSTHYNDVIMGAITSKITSLTIVYSTDYSDTDQRKHQSSASLAFPHKGPVTRKMFPFDDVIMITGSLCGSNHKGPVMRSFDMFFF